jgi:hypothetical protein
MGTLAFIMIRFGVPAHFIKQAYGAGLRRNRKQKAKRKVFL